MTANKWDRRSFLLGWLTVPLVPAWLSGLWRNRASEDADLVLVDDDIAWDDVNALGAPSDWECWNVQYYDAGAIYLSVTASESEAWRLYHGWKSEGRQANKPIRVSG